MGRFQAEQPLFGKVCVGPNHAPPFTPFSRAVNMRSVQTDGSAHPHRERTSPTCFSRHRHCRRAVARSLIHSASISLHPFAPRALPRFIATTDALTPERPVLRVLIRGSERRACFRSGLLASRIKPSSRSASNHLLSPPGPGLVLTRSLPRDLSVASLSGTLASLGLRRYLAGSPRQPAESSSSSCGPAVHLQLLSTPSREDAVTFGYKVQTKLWQEFSSC